MSGYFAGAGFGGDAKERGAYQNKARRNLAVWAWLGFLGGASILFFTFLAVTLSNSLVDGVVLFWFILGGVLLAIGVASWAGSAVVRAIAYEQEYRHGPLASSAAAAATGARQPLLDDAARHAGTDEAPISVDDDFLR